MIKKALILITAFLLTLPSSGWAQDKTNTLDGYVPPPMFGAPRAVPPKKERPKTPKLPKLSTPAQPAPVKSRPAPKKIKTTKQPSRTVIPKAEKPKKKDFSKTIIPLKKPEHPREKFNGKPIEKLPEAGTVERHNIKPGIEPIDLLKKEKEEKPKATPPKPKKASSQGVVKGPKTMPANKKQGVEAEILFEPKTKQPANLIDRAQKKTKTIKAKKKALPPPSASQPQPNFKLPSLINRADGKKQLNLLFAEATSTLNKEQKHTLDKLVITFLNDKSKARIHLSAYASLQSSTLNGDRRLALSRAMEIRKYITEQGISPTRLDIRSLGAQTDVQPMDRVEILLIN